MSEHAPTPVELEALPSERSSVRIETNAKGKAQTKVSVYEGVTEAEMERLMMLAVKTYEEVVANLGERAYFT